MSGGPKPQRWARIRALFNAALELPESRRNEFLRQECGSDGSLADEVRALLEQARDDEAFLAGPISSGLAELRQASREARLQQRVGSYRLVRTIGSGGMGNVYQAERSDEQFEHTVAVKVLRTGRHDPHFYERFRAERQVLANLDHPGICKLLDGGETDDGAPYLVMEYLEGDPIDRYCDAQRLDVTARLRLFQKVCLAVDYAHRKLVVHRDIKPSNIIVNDTGEPKLLDFGVAKLIDAAGAAAATVDGQRMLTPEFASPEQVRGEPVAIATDVYSLGVLLYRLLCGRGPYRLRSDLPSELGRAIIEDQPSRPSTVLQTFRQSDDAESRAIGAARDTSVARLRNRLQGDLDNIALMALRKEPERRYASARALHDDIENFLHHRPVLARPASVGYRAAKFLRRNRGSLALAAGIALVLVVSGLQVIEQRNRAENAAVQAEQVSDYLARLFESASPDRSLGEEITAVDLLAEGVASIDRLAEQPLVQARLLLIMGRSYKWLGYNAESSELLSRGVRLLREYAPDDPATLANAVNMLADNERILFRLDHALVLFQESLVLFRRALGDAHPAVASQYNRMGDVYRMQARYELARQSFEKALDVLGASGNADESLGIDTRGNLALVYDETGRTRRAVEIQAAVVAASRQVDGELHPNTIIRLVNLGLMQVKIGQYEAALGNIREARQLAAKSWTTDLRISAWMAYQHAVAVRELNRLDEAEALHLSAVNFQRDHSGIRTARYARALRYLGTHYVDSGELAKGEDVLRDGLDAATIAGENPGRDAGRLLIQLARAKNAAGQPAEALALADDAVAQSTAIGRNSAFAAHRERAIAMSALGRDREATAAFDGLLAEQQSISGADTVSMLASLRAATRHHMGLGNFLRASDYAERAYQVSMQIMPQSAWRAALARGTYGIALERSGDRAAGSRIRREACLLLEPVLGARHWEVAPLCAGI